jgi:hypothetical protein
MISLNFGRNPFQNISLKKRKQIKNIQDLKKKFEMENFLKLDIDRSDISNFVRLRISNSILMIEKSRHRQIDLENRSSPLCKFEVENELHFTIKCTKLQELRNKFYQKISDILPSFYNLSDTNKCHLIFRSNDYDVSKCCIKGISEMYNLIYSTIYIIKIYTSQKNKRYTIIFFIFFQIQILSFCFLFTLWKIMKYLCKMCKMDTLRFDVTSINQSNDFHHLLNFTSLPVCSNRNEGH